MELLIAGLLVKPEYIYVYKVHISQSSSDMKRQTHIWSFGVFMPFCTGITWAGSADPKLTGQVDHSKFVPAQLQLHGLFSLDGHKEKGIVMAVNLQYDI